LRRIGLRALHFAVCKGSFPRAWIVLSAGDFAAKSNPRAAPAAVRLPNRKKLD